MNRDLADDTLRNYVCAVCWGHLIERFVDGQHLIECGKYGNEHQGFHTRNYADRQLQNSQNDRMDVAQMLRTAGIFENSVSGKTAKEILDELGF